MIILIIINLAGWFKGGLRLNPELVRNFYSDKLKE